MTMTWQNGRRLTSLQQGNNSISYKYDSNGVRTSKTVNGVEYTYEYLGNLLMHETRGDKTFDYCYDANGQLYAVSYRASATAASETYYFSHNWRGDIIGIYNTQGTLVVSYEYDAWGNVISVADSNGNSINNDNHIANLNPFRYRGYYYDSETGLYYLMSRYYDPVTHRFVNADGYFQSGGNILDTNMNTYCRNNPVMCLDRSGKSTTYSGVLFSGGTFSHVPAHELGYQGGQIKEMWKDSDTNCDVSNTITALGTLTGASEATSTLFFSSGEKYLENLKKPNNIGKGIFNEQITKELTQISTLKALSEPIFECAGAASDIVSVSFDVYSGVNENIQNGASGSKIAYDVAVDISCSLLPITVAAVFSIAGPIGTVVGFAAGLVITALIDYIPCDGYSSFRKSLKSNYRG